MDANPIVLDDAAGDVVVVVVEGEHDIYTAPTLRERLDEAIGRGGGIVVDLTGATFVDSSVLGALLDARRRALEAGQGFVVCVGDAVEPGVQRILDITGLVPVLPVDQRARRGDRGRAHQRERRGRMSAAAPDVRLTMPARPEGVAVVRQALAGMADALDFDAAVLADMKMAVSEACTNVVVHAYEDADGMLEVEMARRRARPDDPRPRPRQRHPAAGARSARRARARARPAADRRALGRVRAARQRRPGHRGADDVQLRARRRPGEPRTRSRGASARTGAGTRTRRARRRTPAAASASTGASTRRRRYLGRRRPLRSSRLHITAEPAARPAGRR